MSVGLIALLDDLAAIAKVAAANLDDVASQAAKAGAKAAGVVIDDAAVTPGYVIGFAAKRELPIVGRIAGRADRKSRRFRYGPCQQRRRLGPCRYRPGAWTRPCSRDARVPDNSQRRWHGRHDLGRRRHRPAWPGSIRPAFNRLHVHADEECRGSSRKRGPRLRRLDESQLLNYRSENQLSGAARTSHSAARSFR